MIPEAALPSAPGMSAFDLFIACGGWLFKPMGKNDNCTYARKQILCILFACRRKLNCKVLICKEINENFEKNLRSEQYFFSTNSGELLVSNLGVNLNGKMFVNIIAFLSFILRTK